MSRGHNPSCPNCGREQKLLFTSFYCACDGKDDPLTKDAPEERLWYLECMRCCKPAVWFRRDPLVIILPDTTFQRTRELKDEDIQRLWFGGVNCEYCIEPICRENLNGSYVKRY